MRVDGIVRNASAHECDAHEWPFLAHGPGQVAAVHVRQLQFSQQDIHPDLPGHESHGVFAGIRHYGLPTEVAKLSIDSETHFCIAVDEQDLSRH